MKISGSGMVFVSENHNEEAGLILEEKKETRTLRRTQARLQDIQGLSQAVVDRVSISQDRTAAYQSRYAFSVTGKSSVTSQATGETVSLEQQSAMERLVGGVMDKGVIIKNIREKKDMDLSSEALTGNPEAPVIQGEIRSAETWEMSVKRTEIHFEEESVNFQSSGEVTTEDGRIIRFSLALSLDRAFVSRTEEETLVQTWQERINLTDPLVISLDGRAPTLTDATFEFDLDSDGKAEKISFASSGSGFLAFDKNNDHIINNGSELFGPGTGNGFLELGALDQDHNLWIDENDAVFSQLSVWTRDENGLDRLVSLKDAGIGAISPQSAATDFDLTGADNELRGRLKSTGVFLFENGKAGLIQEMDLASQALDRKETLETGVFQTVRPGPARPSAFVQFPVTASASQPEEAQNPLKELLDRIKQLKEEMAQLYETGNSFSKKPVRSGVGDYGVRTLSFLRGEPGGRSRLQSRWV